LLGHVLCFRRYTLNAMSTRDALRAIPSTNEITELQQVSALIEKYGRNFVLDHIRNSLDEVRGLIQAQEDFPARQVIHSPKDMEDLILKILNRRMGLKLQKNLKRVINATGIVLHTNLGRAPLPIEAVEFMAEIAGGYSNLEFDLTQGARGSRTLHTEESLCRLTGAEAGMIVNNNAAAVFLCLNTFANQKEVIVSRGEQVEIGGSFRIPDIITRSGSRMVEVGTTNKTYKKDYEEAISEGASILLKVHTSNYKVIGFTEETPLDDLVLVSKENNLLTMVDLGSGCMIPLSALGIADEPTVQDCISAGADLITFSGDKLLGGPQAGIIVGKKKLIEELKQNPLARILRCDKNTIAALKAVLDLYLDPETAVRRIPALSMIAATSEQLQQKSDSLKKALILEIGEGASIAIEDVTDEVGGGSLPGTFLAGKAVSYKPDLLQINELQRRLRQAEIPVVCRIFQDKLYFHVRTIDPEDFAVIAFNMKNALEDGDPE